MINFYLTPKKLHVLSFLQNCTKSSLEDTQGKQQAAALKAAIDHARQERNKHLEGSYYYNLITEDLRVKTEQLERYEAEHANTRDIAAVMDTYRQGVVEFLEFVNVMRGRYNKATFQEKRNALDVLGLMVKVRAIPPEERIRGKDPTLEELQARLEINYSPLFTGVRTSGEGRPQNQ